MFSSLVEKKHQMFNFNDQIIDIVNDYKYVGTIISSKTTDIFKKNYRHLAKKNHRKYHLCIKLLGEK